MTQFYLLFLLALLIAGCQPRQPTEASNPGDVLLRENFDRPIGWDSGTQDNVRIGTEGSTYRIHTDSNAFTRGFNSSRYDDVVITVDASQLSAGRNSAYGVVCRGAADDTSSNGYYFLIGGDGSYSIRKGQVGEVNPLIHWARSDAINQGAGFNRIQVMCVDDYLALYVNDQFIVEIRDQTYSGGYIGFTAATSDNQVLDVAFDNLIVQEAALSSAAE